MCDCEPAASLLAKALFPNIDKNPISLFKNAPKPSRGTETALYHGTIITMSGGELSPVEAMAIQGDEILAAGSLEYIRGKAGSQVPVNELGDHCVVPGFIEPHCLILNFGPLEVTQIKEAKQKVEREAQKLPNGCRIIVYFAR
ncbi:hypothetical protein GJ744_001989 [Endocarpon pusillum]|uniref:Amidohydrolase-related domain-containing protein n=1 Tax=Endocarpon pusillum TaxID=364733 RepID=A0A8H7AGA3_9EURO|nr:hypothetical protein GJ744_001989 [Endocarpon pusillum]